MIRVFKRTHLHFKIAILLFTLISLPACEPRALREGDRFYRDGKYEEAIKAYTRGLARDPGSHILNYRAGMACYQKGEFEKAAEHFTRVLLTENPDLEARANYNIGNCKYRQGELREKTDLTTTADLFQEALDYYERAIELDEKDEEAKYNRDFVKNRLEDARSKLMKETTEAKKELPKDGKGKESALGKETFSFSPPPVEKGTASLSRFQQRQTRLERKTSQSMEEVPPTRGETIEMSKQEAEILLEGFSREEEANLTPKDRKRRGDDPEVPKNW